MLTPRHIMPHLSPVPTCQPARSPDGEAVITFAGCATRDVTISLLEETYRRAQVLGQANGWTEEECLRIVFAYGLSYLENQQMVQAVNRGDADVRAELDRMTALYLDASAQYAVMKFRAFTVTRDRDILALNVAGLRGENAAFHAVNDALRQDRDAKREALERMAAENRRLHDEIERLRTCPPGETNHTGWLAWLRRWLAGGRAPSGRGEVGR